MFPSSLCQLIEMNLDLELGVFHNQYLRVGYEKLSSCSVYCEDRYLLVNEFSRIYENGQLRVDTNSQFSCN